jgi:hypothetical protein
MKKKYTIALFVLFIFCLFCGIGMELLWGEQGANKGLMFQRSGALMVILGTAYGLIDGAKTLTLGDQIPLAKLAQIQENQKNKDTIRILNDQAFLLQHAMDARGFFLKYAAIVLLLGTVVWGFGDMFYRLLSR